MFSPREPRSKDRGRPRFSRDTHTDQLRGHGPGSFEISVRARSAIWSVDAAHITTGADARLAPPDPAFCAVRSHPD